MELEALFDAVIVVPLENEETTYGSIIVPDIGKDRNEHGTVVAVGPGKVSDSGALIEMSVKEGDKILYGKYSGTEVNVAGTDYIIMRESDILAVM